jgi:hypothetical protein
MPSNRLDYAQYQQVSSNARAKIAATDRLPNTIHPTVSQECARALRMYITRPCRLLWVVLNYPIWPLTMTGLARAFFLRGSPQG